MPITDDEWDTGTVDPETKPEDTESFDGEYGDEKELVVSFLSENSPKGYTEREILLGADYDRTDDSDAGDRSGIGEAFRRSRRATVGDSDGPLTDLVSEAAGTAELAGDVEAALAELVEAGTVVEREVEHTNGTNTYYRLDGADARTDGTGTEGDDARF
jgi:hypothetical protein